jgi:hypothetical protein
VTQLFQGGSERPTATYQDCVRDSPRTNHLRAYPISFFAAQNLSLNLFRRMICIHCVNSQRMMKLERSVTIQGNLPSQRFLEWSITDREWMKTPWSQTRSISPLNIYSPFFFAFPGIQIRVEETIMMYSIHAVGSCRPFTFISVFVPTTTPKKMSGSDFDNPSQS